jgi:hypothetical protein
LFGNADGDRIWPGTGLDHVDAGKGNDHMVLRADGDADQLQCGPGDDVVVYTGRRDRTDVLTDCERVEVQAGMR